MANQQAHCMPPLWLAKFNVNTNLEDYLLRSIYYVLYRNWTCLVGTTGLVAMAFRRVLLMALKNMYVESGLKKY